MIRIWFLLSLALLTGCQFQVSPWETDVNCPGMSVEENLRRLEALEQASGSKAFYQVAILSDPQQYPGAFEDTIKIVNRLDDVDFILLLGDLAQTGVKAEFEWVCKAMQSSKKPILPVIGNHDALSFGNDIWLDVFGPLDYSFEYQNSKFVGYNDNKYEYDNVPDRGWLAQQAEVAAGELRYHTIGFSHIAPWKDDTQLSAFLQDAGYDLMLHGHEHNFDLWHLYDVDLEHYIAPDTKEKRFGLLSVYPDQLVLENCDKSCYQPTARVLNVDNVNNESKTSAEP